MSSGICEPTVGDVRIIITTSMTDDQIQAIIDDASLMVHRCVLVLACDLQAAIIKWVTAHLIASLSTASSGGTGVVTGESLGDASISYAKPQLQSFGLASTTYGLQAIGLDPNGCLTTIGLRRTLVEVLGNG